MGNRKQLDSLGERLDGLRTVERGSASEELHWQQLLDAVHTQRSQTRATFLLATGGSILALLGTLVIALRGHWAGFTALPLTAIVMAAIAARSATRLSALTKTTNATSLLAGWQDQIRRRTRLAPLSVVVSVAAILLTLWLVHRHGALDPRTWAYVTLSAVLVWYSAYELCVVRPRLQAEQRWLSGSSHGDAEDRD